MANEGWQYLATGVVSLGALRAGWWGIREAIGLKHDIKEEKDRERAAERDRRVERLYEQLIRAQSTSPESPEFYRAADLIGILMAGITVLDSPVSHASLRRGEGYEVIAKQGSGYSPARWEYDFVGIDIQAEGSAVEPGKALLFYDESATLAGQVGTLKEIGVSPPGDPQGHLTIHRTGYGSDQRFEGEQIAEVHRIFLERTQLFVAAYRPELLQVHS